MTNIEQATTLAEALTLLAELAADDVAVQELVALGLAPDDAAAVLRSRAAGR